jgi:hypothetical protein
MQEYAGYIPGKSIDWLSLAKGVKTDIDQGLKAREERKAADEKLFTDIGNRLNSWESTQSQPFNEFTFKGLDAARQKSMEWNRQLKSGEITRSEYQRKINNLNDSFDAFTTASKNLDSYVVGINKAIEDGDASAHMIFSAGINSDLMNIANKKLDVGNNGDFFVVGNDGTYQNVRNYTNMNNVVDKKIKVADTVESVIKNWEPWVLEDLQTSGSVVSEEDIRLNKEFYNNAKADLIGSIVDTNNPRAVVSVLLDNSNLNYQEYYTEQQRINLIQKAISNKELATGKQMSEDEKAQFADKYNRENLIQVVQDNDGKYQPVINEKMIKDAQSVVEDYIEVSLVNKRKEERGFAPSRGDGGDGMTYSEEKDIAKQKEDLKKFQLGYIATLDAFGMTPEGGKGGTKNFSGLSSKYRYKFENGTVKVYPVSDNYMVGDPVDIATDPEGLAFYAVGGSSKADATTRYREGRTQYRTAKGLSGNTKTTTPKKGDIVGGYKFLGGDPSNQNNWKKQ